MHYLANLGGSGFPSIFMAAGERIVVIIASKIIEVDKALSRRFKPVAA